MEFQPPTPENIRYIVQAMCDFCGGPIAARSLAQLLTRFEEYGWKLTTDGKIICNRCLQRKIEA